MQRRGIAYIVNLSADIHAFFDAQKELLTSDAICAGWYAECMTDLKFGDMHISNMQKILAKVGGDELGADDKNAIKDAAKQYDEEMLRIAAHLYEIFHQKRELAMLAGTDPEANMDFVRMRFCNTDRCCGDHRTVYKELFGIS